MKRVIYFFVFFFSAVPFSIGAAEFVPMVGIPGLSSNPDLDTYINALYILAIAIAAFLAVIKLILAGIKYIMSGVVTVKAQAKADISGALIGLLIVLGAVFLLNIINPNLTKFDTLQNLPVLNKVAGKNFLITPNKEVFSEPISIDDPDAADKITAAIANCPEGYSHTIEKKAGYYQVRCYEDSTDTPNSEVEVSLVDGELVATDLYNADSTSITLDCVHEYNTECHDYCMSHSGSYPHRSEPFLCELGGGYEPLMDELHCEISGSHCDTDEEDDDTPNPEPDDSTEPPPLSVTLLLECQRHLSTGHRCQFIADESGKIISWQLVRADDPRVIVTTRQSALLTEDVATNFVIYEPAITDLPAGELHNTPTIMTGRIGCAGDVYLTEEDSGSCDGISHVEIRLPDGTTRLWACSLLSPRPQVCS